MRGSFIKKDKREIGLLSFPFVLNNESIITKFSKGVALTRAQVKQVLLVLNAKFY